jgi:hypothetical protein
MTVRTVRSSVVVAGSAVVKEDGREVELREVVDRDALFEYVDFGEERALSDGVGGGRLHRRARKTRSDNCMKGLSKSSLQKLTAPDSLTVS